MRAFRPPLTLGQLLFALAVTALGLSMLLPAGERPFDRWDWPAIFRVVLSTGLIALLLCGLFALAAMALVLVAYLTTAGGAPVRGRMTSGRSPGRIDRSEPAGVPLKIPPRFAAQSLMIAVAIVAVAMGIGKTSKERACRFQKIADMHENLARKSYLFDMIDSDMEKAVRDHLSSNTDCRYYHFLMMEKYRYAAEHPCFPVRPDPPEPR